MTLSSPHDPLLSGTRIVLTILLFVFGGSLAAIALTTLALPLPQVQQQIADLHLAPGVSTWAFTGRLLAMIALACAVLGTVFFFLRNLRRILDTVRAGDPFVPVNAQRLGRMGWLMVALTLSISALPPTVAWINALLREPGVAKGFEFQIEGLLLALVLFILARVFRHGTAMRDDLEGTV